jgi:hypothetical protein
MELTHVRTQCPNLTLPLTKSNIRFSRFGRLCFKISYTQLYCVALIISILYMPLPLYCHFTAALFRIHMFLLLLASEYNQALNHHKQYLSLFILH